MRAVVQRVSEASVKVEGEIKSKIEKGLMVLVGVEQHDTEAEVAYLAKKIVEMRIFPDQEKQMNRSLLDISGDMLIVSQFTLLADCRKGRRPSFNHAASPSEGNRLYQYFVTMIKDYGINTGTGSFGSMMDVSLVNEGPVTIILDTREWFGKQEIRKKT